MGGSPVRARWSCAAAGQAADHMAGRSHRPSLAPLTRGVPTHVITSLLTVADTSHILFGTDYVFATGAAVPATIRGVQDFAGFTPEHLDAIGHGSALTLFPSLATEAMRRTQ